MQTPHRSLACKKNQTNTKSVTHSLFPPQQKALHPPMYQFHQAEGSSLTAMDDDVSNFTDGYTTDDYPGDDMCEKHDVIRFGTIATPVFFSIVIVLSVVGNILVLIILACYEKNLKAFTNIFILNLAISDLVFTAGLPFWAIYHMWGWHFSELVCKIVTFVFFIGFYSSIFFLTIMTIYRYLAVVHPLSKLSSPRHSTGIFLSVMMWIISISAALPSLLFSSLVEIYHGDEPTWGCEYSSLMWKTVGGVLQNASFLFAFAVMAFCYINIMVKITKTRSNRKNRAVKLVFCIVAVFFIGWVPYNVVIFLKVLEDNFDKVQCGESIRLDYAFFICRFIAFFHCCLNPVLYAFVGVKFRSHLKAMLRGMIKPQSSAEEQQVRLQSLVSHGSLY
ncbi:chemokine XC receptor 1-like [Pholidichthys leucotaenia]